MGAILAATFPGTGIKISRKLAVLAEVPLASARNMLEPGEADLKADA